MRSSLTPSSPVASHQPPATTVGEFAERELIARIQDRLPPPPDWMLVGIGDDAAVVEPARNRAEVLSVDALIEGVHFDRSFVPADAIGYRALAVNLSDLAAMGAAPRAVLLSLALPADLALTDFDGIIGGFTRLAAEHSLHVAGGNITRSPGPLMIDATVIGEVKPRQALRRRGARPGDDLYVSGSVGLAGAGLQILRSSLASPALEPCVQRYLYPEPRLTLGTQLSRNRAATACVDLSDGFADAVRQLAEASEVGVVIDAGLLPIDQAAARWFAQRGVDAVTEAITVGDDYELLFAVRPRSRGRLRCATQSTTTPVTRIGRCTSDGRVVLSSVGLDGVVGQPSETELPRPGYRHFR